MLREIHVVGPAGLGLMLSKGESASEGVIDAVTVTCKETRTRKRTGLKSDHWDTEEGELGRKGGCGGAVHEGVWG